MWVTAGLQSLGWGRSPFVLCLFDRPAGRTPTRRHRTSSASASTPPDAPFPTFSPSHFRTRGVAAHNAGGTANNLPIWNLSRIRGILAAMSKEDAFPTAITYTAPNEIRIRGYAIEQLMGRVDFGQAVYLLLKGELPDQKIGRLITAMLVSSVDHGPSAPSVHGARLAASTGAPLNACVAAGVLNINRYHGGAIEDCARAILEVIGRADVKSITLEQATQEVLDEYKARKYRVAGFGHRLHTKDPRTDRLFTLAEEAGVCGQYVKTCRLIEAALAKQTGKPLPINVDGAIGAVLLELGFDLELMNGFFIMARVPGLIAQSREEATREKKMRRIVPGAHEYDGPPPRDLPS